MQRSVLAWAVTSLSFFALLSSNASAQRRYDPGATDTEIRVGNTMAYSGPASAYATVGRVEAAYFRMINERGGINGRKISFITYDDGYSPPKTVEQVHKLVESDEVLLIFNPLGTASNTAIRKYLNAKSVPQLFVASGAAKWGDPKAFPWTMGWTPNFQLEGQVYARYIVANHPKATIGVLYQNDDLGKDYLKGLRDALGAGAGIMILKEVPFEVTDPTIDSQIVLLKSLNPDILLDFATPKFAAQAIKKLAELNWTPIHVMSNVSISVAAVMRTAGLENGKGTLSAAYLKDPTDPRWRDDSGMSEWRAFMSKYYPDGDKMDAANVYGYSAAQGLAQVLKQCGDDLTRENVMKQAANLDFEIDTFLPGMRVKTSPTDFYPLKQLQMMRFNGEGWDLFGPLISAEIGG